MSEIYQRTGTRSVPENLTDGEVIRQPTILNQVSWGAVFAGVVVALVVQVLLTILGIGIGIARLSPRANTDVFT
ncbi:PhnA-like protein, partial [Rhizobiaceae sp. 2RAB30]